MSIAPAPSNVWLQNGHGTAYLSWAISSGATSYSVQRSTDGVNFTTVATPSATSFLDSVSSTSVAVSGAALIIGNKYIITSLGTTTTANWNTLGVPTTVAPNVEVVFTAAATGAGSGTGTVSPTQTQYFYQVAAVNGSGTSAYTNLDPTGAVLATIPTNSGIASLGAIRLQCQQRADRVNSQYVTLPEWNNYISLSYKELYDLLIAAYGTDYYIATPYTYTTSGTTDPTYNAQVYPLPVDFYKLVLCEVALNPNDPNSWITIRQYERIQQNLWNYPNIYTFYGITNLRYRLTGTQIQLVPIASAGQTLRIWYAPRPAKLVADTDILDGISGWEEYIIVDAAIKALAKEESDVSELMAEKMALKARLESMAQNRNIAEPQKVSDSRMRNLSWGDDGMWGGGGSW